MRSGIPVVEFPRSNARMGPASERLHSATVERRLPHPNDAGLDAHVRQASARDTPRGWRIDKTKCRQNIDVVVALAMAIESAESPTPTVELLGWL